MMPTYEKDFYGWAMGTADLLRERRLNELDFENIIEEKAVAWGMSLCIHIMHR